MEEQPNHQDIDAKARREQIYRGEWEQIQVSIAEEARVEKARLERERLEAIRLEELRLERERVKRQREEESPAEIERQRTGGFEAENRRIVRLRRERRAVALRKFAVCGAFGIVFGLLAFLEIKLQWFPDRSVESANEKRISDSATKLQQHLSDQEIDDMVKRDLKAQGITPAHKVTQQELEEEVQNLPADKVKRFTKFLQRPKAEQQQTLLQFNEHDRALMLEFKVRQFLRNPDPSNQ